MEEAFYRENVVFEVEKKMKTFSWLYFLEEKSNLIFFR
jgi:hypothetical protein